MRAIIIGAGPAGLTAAYELLTRTDIVPIIYEQSQQVGGLSKTIQYRGNRMDIGGHRFFSKSDRVMQWWQKMLPLETSSVQDAGKTGSEPLTITYHRRETTITPAAAAVDPAHPDEVFLVRNRLSRIYFLRKFFKYPLAFSWQTFKNLGIVRLSRILASYFWSRVRPVRPEKSLADFFINRFGRELYLTFFKDYTEKVWGAPCAKISAEWGAQRVKGLSVREVIRHALKSVFGRKDKKLGQKKTETSLIEKFLYPKFGPGQMWEKVARLVGEKGGEIHFGYEAKGLVTAGNVRVAAAKFLERASGQEVTVTGDYFFSTMPVRELTLGLTPPAPAEVRSVAAGLMYRDFITVGLLVKKMKASATGEKIGQPGSRVPDNWIYIQERDVRLGRLQVFNNWSPYLVRDPNTVWLGLEYFCQEGDDLWNKSDEEFKQFAVDELVKIDMIERADVLDATVAREPKTYPAYFGTYDKFSVVRDYLNRFGNLFLIGRNGMHRYNNQDHSMLTAMVAVDNIVAGATDKSNIWAVNTEEAYHEEK